MSAKEDLKPGESFMYRAPYAKEGVRCTVVVEAELLDMRKENDVLRERLTCIEGYAIKMASVARFGK